LSNQKNFSSSLSKKQHFYKNGQQHNHDSASNLNTDSYANFELPDDAAQRWMSNAQL